MAQRKNSILAALPRVSCTRISKILNHLIDKHWDSCEGVNYELVPELLSALHELQLRREAANRIPTRNQRIDELYRKVFTTTDTDDYLAAVQELAEMHEKRYSRDE